MDDQGWQVVGQAAGGGLRTGVLELPDQHLQAQRAVLDPGRLVERPHCDGTRPAGYSERFFEVVRVERQRYVDGSGDDHSILQLRTSSLVMPIEKLPTEISARVSMVANAGGGTGQRPRPELSR